jgi:hypothetical protein
MAVFWVVAPCSLVEVYLARSGPYSPLVRSWFLPWLTVSYISNRFHARGLLIALMMEAARTSETSVNFYQTTRRYNVEDSHLRTNRRENLKSYCVLYSRISFDTETLDFKY